MRLHKRRDIVFNLMAAAIVFSIVGASAAFVYWLFTNIGGAK